jgi:hypothetical protein
MPTGNHRAYILDQLRRAGRHDLVQAIEGGLISAYAVATELGMRKRNPVLGTALAIRPSAGRSVYGLWGYHETARDSASSSSAPD